ncbi:MAG: BON domain-containing protein [Chlamydiales bacterium]|nr:BON domain-containing protein [Chlamydiales bacterium]
MSKSFITLASACVFLMACNQEKPANGQNAGNTRQQVSLADEAPGVTEADRRITQDIRKALADRKTLSDHAKNVRVVTTQSVVELSGPVDTEAEKKEVGVIAETIPGVSKVNNQLEVTSKGY